MPGVRPHLGAGRRVALPEVAPGIHLALPEGQAPRAWETPEFGIEDRVPKN